MRTQKLHELLKINGINTAQDPYAIYHDIYVSLNPHIDDIKIDVLQENTMGVVGTLCTLLNKTYPLLIALEKDMGIELDEAVVDYFGVDCNSIIPRHNLSFRELAVIASMTDSFNQRQTKLEYDIDNTSINLKSGSDLAIKALNEYLADSMIAASTLDAETLFEKTLTLLYYIYLVGVALNVDLDLIIRESIKGQYDDNRNPTYGGIALYNSPR